jgi:hypothetical protein
MLIYVHLTIKFSQLNGGKNASKTPYYMELHAFSFARKLGEEPNKV